MLDSRQHYSRSRIPSPRLSVYVYGSVCVCVCVCDHVRVCVYLYTHTHTHRHTNRHIDSCCLIERLHNNLYFKFLHSTGAPLLSPAICTVYTLVTRKPSYSKTVKHIIYSTSPRRPASLFRSYSVYNVLYITYCMT